MPATCQAVKRKFMRFTANSLCRMTLAAREGYTPRTVKTPPKGRELWDGARLKEIREARGLSQKEVGQRAGLQSGTEISRHERNAVDSNPTVAIVGRIAAALEVSISALFEPVGYPIPRPEGSGHAERRRDGVERSAILQAVLDRRDQKTPAEDSWRGDVLRAQDAITDAAAALNRALRRPADSGESGQQAAKVGR
jgi:transcriptional regulator with XRE-family HTH domain